VGSYMCLRDISNRAPARRAAPSWRVPLVLLLGGMAG
jgi:hypothetical protein